MALALLLVSSISQPVVFSIPSDRDLIDQSAMGCRSCPDRQVVKDGVTFHVQNVTAVQLTSQNTLGMVTAAIGCTKSVQFTATPNPAFAGDRSGLAGMNLSSNLSGVQR